MNKGGKKRERKRQTKKQREKNQREKLKVAGREVGGGMGQICDGE